MIMDLKKLVAAQELTSSETFNCHKMATNNLIYYYQPSKYPLKKKIFVFCHFPSKIRTRVCDKYMSEIYKQRVNDISIMEKRCTEQCLPNCEEVNSGLSMTITNLNPDSHCNKASTSLYSLAEEKFNAVGAKYLNQLQLKVANHTGQDMTGLANIGIRKSAF